MTAAILRRFAWCSAMVLFVITITFAILHLAPGDPARALVGPHATEETMAHARAWHGLDRSVPEQYFRYLNNLAHGDLGQSYRSHREVREILADHAWPTLQLVLTAVFLQLAFGIPLGVAAVRRYRRATDRSIVAAAIVALAAPAFVVGLLLLYLLGFRLGWLPVNGYGAGLPDRLGHLILPALTMALSNIASTALFVRSEMARSMDEDFIRTARAKGVSERGILWRHALRPSIGPAVSVTSVDFGVLLTSAVVAESIFGWPGLGREALQAVIELDIPLVLGIVIVTSVTIAIASFLVDLAVLAIDPRGRRET
jgi:peptide/nickel transport system permease protein